MLGALDGLDIVYLATDDFRFSYEMIARFKEQHIPFSVLRAQDPIPLRSRIIVTTAAEARLFSSDKLVLYPSGGHGPDFIVARIKNYLKNITQIKSVVVGIDPGKRVGVIVLVNDLLMENHTVDIEDLSRRLKRILLPFESEHLIIRIGSGSRRYLSRVIHALRQTLQFTFQCELVDERRTTRGRNSFSKFKLSPHEIAALHIAIRSGDIFDLKKFSVEHLVFTEGEVSYIQERSRFASDGRITISRTLARKVLAGALSLHQALALQLQHRIDL